MCTARSAPRRITRAAVLVAIDGRAAAFHTLLAARSLATASIAICPCNRQMQFHRRPEIALCIRRSAVIGSKCIRVRRGANPIARSCISEHSPTRIQIWHPTSHPAGVVPARSRHLALVLRGLYTGEQCYSDLGWRVHSVRVFFCRWRFRRILWPYVYDSDGLTAPSHLKWRQSERKGSC
jgi:hypothetical protein